MNFKPAGWHHLRLVMKGNELTGFVNGKKLAAVTDKSGAKGMPFLASTYNWNLFDNVRVGHSRESQAVLAHYLACAFVFRTSP